MVFVEAAGDVDPVRRTRHLYIGEQDIEAVTASQQITGGIPVLGGHDDVTGILKRLGNGDTDQALVFDQQNAI